jgi:dihydrofolate reductase
MGRHTYDSFAAVWSERSGDPYTDTINSMNKYVVSSTLSAAQWANTSVISGDVVAEIKHLKDQPGRDIVQYGFGPLSHLLLQHGLLDEVRLWVHPFFLRRGAPNDLLFREGSLAKLDLLDAKTLKSGIVILSYGTGQTTNVDV